MDEKFYFLIFIFLVKLNSINGQDEMMQCRYYNHTNGLYSCDLTIYNPYGLNNFTAINGTHLSGKTDALVKYIFRDQIFVTPNIPSIICKQFQNLDYIDFQSSGIKKLDSSSFIDCKKITNIYLYNSQISQIGENTFKNCQNLIYIYLHFNKIRQLDEKSFNGASKVQHLYLNFNPIQNFPKNIFNPLTNLVNLHAYFTNLSVIHSNSFGVHLKLTGLYLHHNQIDAFDERIIDKTTVSIIDMTNNTCANKIINDTTMLRDSMRLAMKTCFLNYENLTMGTTTTISSTASTTTSYIEQTTTTALTLPPGCIGGNTDERVCRIEDEIQDIHEQSTNFTTTINKMQDQIDELLNRPCACR
ncbi:unnamed protein product [Chironomus riparius]|uniref:Uncharacterized protein n=1 Tax=Chironomus riparius TaxID=315576 RepID=A0A9N9RKF4_9DIPT|nr:unnamed protein product [Chironomus riparius]